MAWNDYNPFTKKNIGLAAGYGADILGTALNLPEMGYSEKWAGGPTPFGIAKARAAESATPWNTPGSDALTQEQYDAMMAHQAANDAEYANAVDTGGGTGGGEAPTTFQQWFNGVLYTDAGEYTNAVTAAITKSFNDANAQIQKAYDLGLLDIGQKEEMIKNNRKKALSSIQASFASASPEATQSEQFRSETSANKEAQTNQANLDLYKNQFTLEKENALANNAQLMNQNKDTILNNALEVAPDAGYANSVAYQAPTLSNNVLGQFQNVAGVAAQGNPQATKAAVQGAQVPEDIKSWLYANYANK